MKDDRIDEFVVTNESSDILEDATLTFEENSIVEDSGKGDYSCKCISQETCCGCFVQ